ncbi:MAG: hypothetical protein K9L68_04715 [Spirochaetales bacterium]|nr:hypothetical protein [Spirochaetales bacterium]
MPICLILLLPTAVAEGVFAEGNSDKGPAGLGLPPVSVDLRTDVVKQETLRAAAEVSAAGRSLRFAASKRQWEEGRAVSESSWDWNLSYKGKILRTGEMKARGLIKELESPLSYSPWSSVYTEPADWYPSRDYGSFRRYGIFVGSNTWPVGGYLVLETGDSDSLWQRRNGSWAAGLSLKAAEDFTLLLILSGAPRDDYGKTWFPAYRRYPGGSVLIGAMEYERELKIPRDSSAPWFEGEASVLTAVSGGQRMPASWLFRVRCEGECGLYRGIGGWSGDAGAKGVVLGGSRGGNYLSARADLSDVSRRIGAQTRAALFVPLWLRLRCGYVEEKEPLDRKLFRDRSFDMEGRVRLEWSVWESLLWDEFEHFLVLSRKLDRDEEGMQTEKEFLRLEQRWDGFGLSFDLFWQVSREGGQDAEIYRRRYGGKLGYGNERIEGQLSLSRRDEQGEESTLDGYVRLDLFFPPFSAYLKASTREDLPVRDDLIAYVNTEPRRFLYFSTGLRIRLP